MKSAMNQRDEPAKAAPTPADAGPSWDPLVRMTHWGVAAAVLLNGIVTEGGSQFHVWIGYAAFAFLALRLLWGVIGTEPARFTSFPPNLAAARDHALDLLWGRHRRHRSHNPLGALMVYALWGTLSLMIATGVWMSGSPFAPVEGGDRAAAISVQSTDSGGDHDRKDGRRPKKKDGGIVGDIHETLANLLLLLAALHVGGVVLESRLSGVNLVRGMTVGYRGKADGT